MALTGIDPNDPIPATRRELIFGAGLSSTGPNREVLFYGNKTVAGSEATDTLGDAIADDSDCKDRFGKRSELYQMYKKYTAIDGAATIYAIAVPDGAGAASVVFTVATVPSGPSALKFTIVGVDVEIPISTNEPLADICTAARDAINASEGASLPVIATAGATTVTITAANTGYRGNFIVSDTPATWGARAVFIKDVATTITKGAPALSAGADNGTAAIAEAANTEKYYHVSPWHNGAGTYGNPAPILSTDNQTGELLDMIKTQALPVNGKEQCMIGAFVGTQGQASVAGIAMNSVRGFMFHAEGSDWTPAMLAAQNAAVVRSQQIVQPAANFAGYVSTDRTVYHVPAPFLVANRPTTTEIRADLNNGISPIAYSPLGSAYLVRFVTSSNHVPSSVDKDYRARPGHITSVIDFAWGIVKQRWNATKQPFVANDPGTSGKTLAKTTTPLLVQALIAGVIDELTGSTPLGRYQGPILAPDKVSEMKSSIVVTKGAATISVSVDFYSVEHLYKGEFTIKETGAAY
jgi:phage tail sheath gpL-like